MVKCENCKRVFENEDAIEITETHGMETPPYEKFYVCPYCHGQFETANKCRVCGEYDYAEDMIDNVCPDCIDKYSKDIDFCYKLGEKDVIPIHINGLLFTVYSKEEIEEILFEHLKQSKKDISDFAKCDVYWFASNIFKRKY